MLLPILYTVEMFPKNISWILKINPLAHLIDAYRSIFYYQTIPNFGSLLYLTIVSVAILLIGYSVFRKLEKGFAEEV